MYHGIILDLEFKDSTYPQKFKLFAKRKSSTSGWLLYGVEVGDQEIDKVILEVQENMKDDKPYYAHFYNDNDMIVVFKKNVFRVKPHISTWAVINYGKKLNIPQEQLDFWPNRFQDEIHYFDKADFVQ